MPTLGQACRILLAWLSAASVAISGFAPSFAHADVVDFGPVQGSIDMPTMIVVIVVAVIFAAVAAFFVYRWVREGLAEKKESELMFDMVDMVGSQMLSSHCETARDHETDDAGVQV